MTYGLHPACGGALSGPWRVPQSLLTQAPSCRGASCRPLGTQCGWGGFAAGLPF